MPAISLTVYYQGRSEEMDRAIEKLVGKEPCASGQFLPTAQRDIEFEIELRDLPRIARKLKKAGFTFTTQQEELMPPKPHQNAEASALQGDAYEGPVAEGAVEQPAEGMDIPEAGHASGKKQYPRFQSVLNRSDAGVKLVRDHEKWQYFIAFGEKPTEELLAHVKPGLKEAHTHWNPDIKAWARHYTKETRFQVEQELQQALNAAADKIVEFKQGRGESIGGEMSR